MGVYRACSFLVGVIPNDGQRACPRPAYPTAWMRSGQCGNRQPEAGSWGMTIITLAFYRMVYAFLRTTPRAWLGQTGVPSLASQLATSTGQGYIQQQQRRLDKTPHI